VKMEEGEWDGGDIGTGRDNRSAGGVWMTGDQPDGALLRCPGPPAAA
jgi:hypothetical protein